MSIAPIQLLKVDNRANLYAAVDDSRDKFIMIAAFDGGSGLTPDFTETFAGGCFLLHTTDKTIYINTAASGLAPIWLLLGTSTPASLPNNQIFVGNGSNVPSAVTMGFDATIDNTGNLTITPNAITTAKILDGAVTLAKLAAGITPSHIVKFGGQVTTAGGAPAEVIAITGAQVTDLAFVQMVDNGTNNASIVSAVVTADTLTVTFSADPGADAVINYQLLRAAA